MFTNFPSIMISVLPPSFLPAPLSGDPVNMIKNSRIELFSHLWAVYHCSVVLFRAFFRSLPLKECYRNIYSFWRNHAFFSTLNRFTVIGGFLYFSSILLKRRKSCLLALADQFTIIGWLSTAGTRALHLQQSSSAFSFFLEENITKISPISLPLLSDHENKERTKSTCLPEFLKQSFSTIFLKVIKILAN